MSKLNKIVLTTDIILNVGTPTAGESGKILITQDGMGFHNVNLPEGSYGNIYIEPTPGKSTLLEYLVDDVGIYWTSTILTPANPVVAPSTINNVTWNYLDATSVQIRFTAPSGNPSGLTATNADRYNIYVSNAPITSGTSIQNLSTYKNTFVPKAAGSTETFTLTNLTPKQTYYIVITASKTTFGKTLEGAGSNIINFVTLPLEGGGADGTTPILIPIKSYNARSWYTCFDSDTDGTVLDQTWMVDYSNTSIQNGVPSGFTNRITTMIHSNQFKADFYNQEQLFIFDFEDYFTVTGAYLVPIQGGSDKQLYFSSDGTNWIYVGSFGGTVRNTWVAAALLNTTYSNIRYAKMVADPTSREKYQGICFLGRRESAQDIKGHKYKKASPDLTLQQRMGTNSNVAQNIPITENVASLARLYSNHVWYLDNIPKYQQGSTTFSLDTMDYKFANSNVGNSDDYFYALHAAGVDIMFCMVGMPIFLDSASDNPGYSKLRKPLDPGLDMTLLNTTNPLNYKYLAQFYWQFAARYGSTSGQTDSLFRINSGDTIKKGLGYVKYYEMGLNECTNTSADYTHTNAEEFAAILSACYDGHKGAMGAGFGIKDADPTAIPVMAGLTGVDVGYKEAMFRWWDANRGVGDYPIKVINEHFYNIEGGRAVSDNLYGQYNIYSLPPEQGDFVEYVNDHISLRDRNPQMQNLEVWISEFGYDQHLGSPFSPKDSIPANRGLKKAIWLMRVFLIADYLQLDRLIQYCQFGYHYLSELPDSGGQNIYVNFATSGYIDGSNGTSKLPAYYYVTAFKNAMSDYKFSHVVRYAGQSYTSDVVTKTTDPNLYVFCYKSDGKKPMLVLWLGTDTLAGSANIDITVGASEVSISGITFSGLETSLAETGTAGTISSSVDGSARKITLSVTSTPQIIFTDNVGTPNLIDPTDIAIQALSANQIKLAWTDKNLGTNNTRVYRSDNPVSGFTQIYDNYIDTGTYTDSGLAEATSYYYKLQFDSGSATSNLSSVYGISTLKNIPVPSGFTSTAQSPSTITLGWAYGSTDTAYIDGFELWRSNDIAGVYSKIATISNNLTSYVNTGLVADTTYYYKLRAYKGLSFGNYTTALSTTTDPITLATPTLLSTETSYSGDRLTLTFDLPMADASGQQSYFTVVENPGTDNRVIPALSVSTNTADNSKVNVFLASGVTSTGSTIKFSYDGSGGTIQTIYAVKAASISNQSVTNRLNDASLVNQLIKVNLCNSTHGSGLSDWNDYSVTGLPYNATQYVIDTHNSVSTGATGYKFTLVEDHPASHIQGNYDVAGSSGSYFSTGNTINSTFPISVRAVGGEILGGTFSGDGNNILILSLMKLDATKLYNAKIYSWEYPGINGTIHIQGNGAGTDHTLIPSGNTNGYIYLTNLKATNITLPITSGNPSGDGYTSNKITINAWAQGDKASVSAIIFEEVIDN